MRRSADESVLRLQLMLMLRLPRWRWAREALMPAGLRQLLSAESGTHGTDQPAQRAWADSEHRLNEHFGRVFPSTPRARGCDDALAFVQRFV
jgi:hypothetical protein